MNGIVWRVVRVLVLLAFAAAMTWGAMQIPSSTWRSWGERAAVVSAGLDRPQESLSYILEALAAEEKAAAPTVPASNGTASAQEAAAAVIPPKGDGGGAVEEHVLTGGTEITQHVRVKNASGVAYDFAALLEEGLPFTPAADTAPQVLIVHTHATECYMAYYAGYYNDDDATRSTDAAVNMLAVGEAVAAQLRAQGIGVIHDTTLHDHPAYTGAYTRAETTIQSYLKKYPSIRVVLDIHRDAMLQSDQTKIKPTVSVAGRKAAQVMAVIGGTNTAELPNAHCRENLRLALQFHRAMNTAYDGIMRPLYVVDARYNQGLLAGSMLLEIGTDANTLSEAVYSAQLVGKQLSGLLLSDS